MTDADDIVEPAIRIEYFTDPLCCWSWAFEPVWRRVRQRYGRPVARQCVLGGMIESWSTFRDPLNDVGRPSQLAPLWHLAARTTGVAIDPLIWHVDPPSSSYPASVAVKAAARQGADAGERYLALVREAVMTRRLNVARPEVLRALGNELAVSLPGAFDASQFADDLVGDEAAEAFAADLQRTRMLGIGRFPTLIVRGPAGSRMAVGYRPFDAMERILDAVAGDTAATSDTAATPGATPEAGR